MKKTLLLFLLLFPLSIFSEKLDQDKDINKRLSTLEENNKKLESNSKELLNLKEQFEYQNKIHEQTLNSISNQLSASSYSLTIFGVLFGIVALVAGVYITYIERKIVNIREQNETLLAQAIQTKNEVVSINDLIQKDIFGLFLKIRREETVHILSRLSKVPKDIANFSQQLLSRELEKEDFSILKEAYLKIDNEDGSNSFMLGMSYKDQYKILFFQHFLDLTLKDDLIGNDLIDFYPSAITCAFENDILKSTEDFMKGIIDIGYQSKTKEINSYIKGISGSEFKNFENLYSIMFNYFKNRDDKFKFFNIISNDKDKRHGKAKYGQLLINAFAQSECTESEKIAIENTREIIIELEKEQLEKQKKLETGKKSTEKKK